MYGGTVRRRKYEVVVAFKELFRGFVGVTDAGQDLASNETYIN